MFGAHSEGDSAARRKFRSHDGFSRRAGADKIVQNAVCHGFVERALVAIGGQVEFERFTLDAEFCGDVFDRYLGKIHLAGDGAKRSEIRRLESNPVGAFRRIRECFQARFGRRRRQARIGFAQQAQAGVFSWFCHKRIKRGRWGSSNCF